MSSRKTEKTGKQAKSISRKTKWTRSISIKINTKSVLKMFWSFLFIDIVIILMTLAVWGVSSEYASSTDPGSNHARHFKSIESIENDYPGIKKTDSYRIYENADELNSSITLPDKRFQDNLTKTFYVFKDRKDSIHYIYSGSFLVMLTAAMFVLSIIELVIILINLIWGTGKIRRELMPLDDLAFKADMLARASSLDQQALDELEDAINRINPTGDGVSLHTDSKELAELESAINGLLERMRETYQQQSRFVSDASHELRTPISVLQGYVNMLDRWGKSDGQILDESIEAIKSETEHMKKLVEQLLFLARGDSGRTKLVMEEFSLTDMMREVYEESLMIDKKHQYRFAADNGEILIKGDISMLKQTARILIDNAAKYTSEDAQITIRTALRKSLAEHVDGDAADTQTETSENTIPVFIIQDEGIGMAGSDVSHIFERFYRSDPARTKVSGGTGLGLSIAKWIVDRHGGYFDVLSREDIGTRITVCLPQKQQQ